MSYNIRKVDHIVQQNGVIWTYARGDYGPPRGDYGPKDNNKFPLLYT